MAWTVEKYRAAMRALPTSVRQKAIDAANRLLDQGEDERRAVQLGIARAKRWAVRRQGRTGRADDW
jgi:uncharacterized protein YdaT